MNENIETMFNKIIDEATKEINEELKTAHEQLEQSYDKNQELIKENNELKNTLSKYKLVSEVGNLITKENFEAMLPLFKLKHNDFQMNGMDIEDVPEWFLYLFHYYEDRDRLFNLMDHFGIKYPAWAKNYKMPYEYSEKELGEFVKYDRYITNGCIFSSNIGFFWRNVKRCCCDTHKILTDKNSFEDAIPWQLILSNLLWTKDELFIKILENIKSKKHHSEYFFEIQNYIEISDSQINELIKLLPPDKLFSEHLNFIKRNQRLIKGNTYFAEKFRDKISDNTYSPFYYLIFPLEDQKNFIKGIKDVETIMKLINRMEITKEEKINFSMEFL